MEMTRTYEISRNGASKGIEIYMHYQGTGAGGRKSATITVLCKIMIFSEYLYFMDFHENHVNHDFQHLSAYLPQKHT